MKFHAKDLVLGIETRLGNQEPMVLTEQERALVLSDLQFLNSSNKISQGVFIFHASDKNRGEL